MIASIQTVAPDAAVETVAVTSDSPIDSFQLQNDAAVDLIELEAAEEIASFQLITREAEGIDLVGPTGPPGPQGEPGVGSTDDASSTVKGITKLSVDPDTPTEPVAFGVNDPDVVLTGDARLSDDRTANAIRTATVIDIATDADPTDQQVMTYDDGSGKWKPADAPGGGTGDVIGPSVAVDSDFAQFDTTTGKLIKDGGLSLDIDDTLAADSDSRIPSQQAVKGYVDANIGGSGTPGGSDGQAQYRVDGSTFGGMPYLTSDGTATYVSSGHTYFQDSVDPTKQVLFDLSQVPAAATFSILMPTTTGGVIPVGNAATTDEFVTGLGSDGILTKAQPAFVNLSDVPADYTGEGEKIVAVKADESGLEFIAPAGPGYTRSVATAADATSITPTTDDDTNIVIQTNMQAAGTLTINAPSATAEARGLLLRIKCTNAQTLSFNAIYRAPSLLPLPANISAAKTVYIGFSYNSIDSKWDLTAVMKEY